MMLKIFKLVFFLLICAGNWWKRPPIWTQTGEKIVEKIFDDKNISTSFDLTGSTTRIVMNFIE